MVLKGYEDASIATTNISGLKITFFDFTPMTENRRNFLIIRHGKSGYNEGIICPYDEYTFEIIARNLQLKDYEKIKRLSLENRLKGMNIAVVKIDEFMAKRGKMVRDVYEGGIDKPSSYYGIRRRNRIPVVLMSPRALPKTLAEYLTKCGIRELNPGLHVFAEHPQT